MAKKLGNGDSKPTHEEIAQRARAIYEQSGCAPGRDQENWLEAEAQLMAARQQPSDPQPSSQQSFKETSNRQESSNRPTAKPALRR